MNINIFTRISGILLRVLIVCKWIKLSVDCSNFNFSINNWYIRYLIKLVNLLKHFSTLHVSVIHDHYQVFVNIKNVSAFVTRLCNTMDIVKAQRLVNPRFYCSEVVKVRKMLVNASISGFYQTTAVNDSIYQLVKARFVWLWLCVFFLIILWTCKF
jgi:hypothetical protein